MLTCHHYILSHMVVFILEPCLPILWWKMVQYKILLWEKTRQVGDRFVIWELPWAAFSPQTSKICYRQKKFQALLERKGRHNMNEILFNNGCICLNILIIICIWNGLFFWHLPELKQLFTYLSDCFIALLHPTKRILMHHPKQSCQTVWLFHVKLLYYWRFFQCVFSEIWGLD